jgi:hypothetical protein
MKEAFRSPNAGTISLYQSILDDAEIPYFVRNAITQQTIVGGLMTALLPLPDFWPTLCLLRDEDYPEAMQLLSRGREPVPPEQHDWTCVACGESVPDNFTSCWFCQADRASQRLGETD